MSSGSDNSGPQMPGLVPTKRKYNRPPRPKTSTHYGTTHQKLRALLLSKYPICQLCESNASVEAHHIVYPARALEDYRAVCTPCHQSLHKILGGHST